MSVPAIPKSSKDKIVMSTVLPLITTSSALSLSLGEDWKRLENGYTLIKREHLPILKHMQEDMTLVRQNLNNALHAEVVLQTHQEFQRSGDLNQDRDKGDKELKERIERFILAMNLNGRLWSFQPYVRYTWEENENPENWRFIAAGSSDLISTYKGSISVEDFLTASRLTTKIDFIYSHANEKEFPAVKTAFRSLRLGCIERNTSIRFLQEAIALEALCSTDSIEVTHKVASTCAILLGSTLNERRSVYKKAKDLYNKRSKIIHGCVRDSASACCP